MCLSVCVCVCVCLYIGLWDLNDLTTLYNRNVKHRMYVGPFLVQCIVRVGKSLSHMFVCICVCRCRIFSCLKLFLSVFLIDLKEIQYSNTVLNPFLWRAGKVV